MNKNKKKKQEEKEEFDTPTSCPVCKKCRKRWDGRCFYGGPFTGYYNASE
jgi:hypothetical protein